jgi:hypothetical protein
MTKRSHLIRVIGIVLPMIAAVASATGPESDNLVGRNVPPYPAGLDELQGACIPGGPLPAQICDYSLTVVGRFATDPALGATPTQLLAMRNLDPGARQARWNGGCRIDRVGSANVVAFVRHGAREYSRDVRWARQFDIASGTLVPVAAKRVDCINEGLGI